MTASQSHGSGKRRGARSEHRPTPSEPESVWETRTRNAVDASLAGAAILVPLSMGGPMALRYLALALAATAAAVSTAFWMVVRPRAASERTGVEWLIVAGAALLVVQLVPLSESWLRTISPEIAKQVSLWTSDAEGSLGVWRTLSLNPVATFRGLTSFLSCAILFLVAAHRMARLDDVEKMLKLVAASAVGIAIFGLVQYFTSNGKFFWVYENPQSSTSTYVKGPFANRNHFASFLATGLGPMLWWALAKARGAEGGAKSKGGFGVSSNASLPLWIGAGLIALAGMMSLSRGGFLAMAATVVVCAVVHFRAGLIPARVAAALGCGAVLFSVVLAVFGLGKMEDRIGTIASGSADQLDAHGGRRLIWAANWRATAAFPVLGAGAGTHRDVYRGYLDGWFPREFLYAESTFFQLGLETGGAGLLLTALAVAIVFTRGARTIARTSSKHSVAAQAAALSGLAGSTLHGFVDFVWYMPGCIVPVLLLAACVLRMDQLERHQSRAFAEREPAPLPLRMALLAGSVVLGAWLVASKVPALRADPHANRHFVLTRVATGMDSTATISRQRLEAIAAAVDADPADGRLHMRLATECLLAFNDAQSNGENPMMIPQLRDAALTGGFETRDATRAWVERVAGGNLPLLRSAQRHARRALQLCPTQARAYLVLSELAFLDGLPARDDCVAEAKRLDPTDGIVLVAAGGHHWSRGEIDEAIATWKTAFHQNPFSRAELLSRLAPAVEARFFLDRFEPTWEHLLQIRDKFERLERLDELAVVLERLAAVAEERAATLTGREASDAWRIAGESRFRLQQEEQAGVCLKRSVEVDVNSYDARLALGRFLLARREFGPAAEQLQWCSRRKPRDATVRRLADDATKASLRDPSIAGTSYDWRRSLLESRATGDAGPSSQSLPSAGTATGATSYVRSPTPINGAPAGSAPLSSTRPIGQQPITAESPRFSPIRQAGATQPPEDVNTAGQTVPSSSTARAVFDDE